jgi:hypothetical protein
MKITLYLKAKEEKIFIPTFGCLDFKISKCTIASQNKNKSHSFVYFLGFTFVDMLLNLSMIRNLRKNCVFM